MSFETPFALDDWIFMANYRDDAGGSKDFALKAWGRYYEFIRNYDNGRLSNALAPIFTMFSPWKDIFPLLTGMSVAWSAMLVAKFQPYGSRTVLLAFTWVLMIVCLPWRDTLFVHNYSLNYLWASAVTLSFLWCLWKYCTGAGSGPALRALCLILAVIAGAWHEGFAVPTLCGLGLLALSRRFRMGPAFYLITTVYLLSTLLFMLSPGVMGRVALAGESSHWLPSIKICLILIIDVFLGIAYVLLIRLYNIRIDIIRSKKAVIPVVIIGIIVSGYVIALFSTNTPRSYFWPNMAAICLAVWLVSEILRAVNTRKMANHGQKGVSGKGLRIAAKLAVVVCLAQSAAAIVWQARFRQDADRYIALLEESGTVDISYDFKWPMHAPWYTFGMTLGNSIWSNPWNVASLETYFTNAKARH